MLVADAEEEDEPLFNKDAYRFVETPNKYRFASLFRFATGPLLMSVLAGAGYLAVRRARTSAGTSWLTWAHDT